MNHLCKEDTVGLDEAGRPEEADEGAQRHQPAVPRRGHAYDKLKPNLGCFIRWVFIEGCAPILVLLPVFNAFFISDYPSFRDSDYET